VHGSPWGFSETPARIGIAPGLGADTGAVLAGLGYDAAAIEDLRARRIV
jgi:crotonobetainyl-CoA:carnitine CoA-transferase CaiB-like acyl-CoA transferase